MPGASRVTPSPAVAGARSPRSRGGARRDRFVALVDPAAQQLDRHVVVLRKPRGDPARLVHAVAELRHELLSPREKQRARQLHADEEVRTGAAEEDEYL